MTESDEGYELKPESDRHDLMPLFPIMFLRTTKTQKNGIVMILHRCNLVPEILNYVPPDR
jgi:hypothetical protein